MTREKKLTEARHCGTPGAVAASVAFQRVFGAFSIIAKIASRISGGRGTWLVRAPRARTSFYRAPGGGLAFTVLHAW